MRIFHLLGSRLRVGSELFEYLWSRREWWLMPLVGVLLLFGALFGIAISSGLGPFIYAIF